MKEYTINIKKQQPNNQSNKKTKAI